MHSRTVAEVSEQEQIDGVVRRLTAIGLPPAYVESEVRERFSEWHDARVRDFVPIFVERAVRERIEAAVPAAPRQHSPS